MKKMIQHHSWLAVAGLLLALGAPAALASQPQTGAAACATADSDLFLGAQTEASYAFEGCWAYWAAGPCYDVYRDSAGAYWICRLCGQTTKPGPGQCSQIGAPALSSGYWCS